jgi:hypothetical protein
MDGIAMDEHPVLHDTTKLMPVEVLVPLLQFLKGLHVIRNRVMVPQHYAELALRKLVQQGLDKLFRRGHGTAEDPVLGPLEVKDIPIEDKDIDLFGRRLELMEVPPRPGVMAEKM